MGRPFGAKGKFPRKDKSLVPLMERKAKACKKYEKTFKGRIMRTYRNMKSRVLGIQKEKAHIYKGLALLPKEDFYTWALNDLSYKILYDAWLQADYNRKLTPSIDRIDSKKGYIEGNMRWITHSENSRLGNLSRFSEQTSTIA